MSDLAQRSVLVLGLGESGLAMTRWCLREGARVRVADTRESPPNREAVSTLDIELKLGPFDVSLLEGIDLVAISPGLSPIAKPQSTLLGAAKSASIPVVGEIELFARKLTALKLERGYDPRVIAITGTNGKTTVTKLVGEMCRSANRSVVVAGNVSPAALDALGHALDGALPDVWVLELSSFQLETTTTLEPTAATVLNVTQDHLDWHGTMDAYAKAKASIFAATTVRVINRDDPRVAAMDDDAAPSVRFGLDAPVLPGDFGLARDKFDDDGLRWLALAEGDDPPAEAVGVVPGKIIGKRRAGKPVATVPASDVRSKRLMPVDALKLRGDHNVANVLAALALGRAIGLSMAAMLRAAGAYRGEPHRVAFVLERAGVDYIEDSKGTNVGATVAALKGLGRKVVLIAGGLGKGQDFSPLAAPVAQHARAVLLIGRDKALLRTALVSTGVALFDCETLDQAVEDAALIAEPGDAVLLSPACASLDMFRDYEDRADVFVAAVHRIDQGVATVEGGDMLNGLLGAFHWGRDRKGGGAPTRARNAVDPLRPTRSTMMAWDKPLFLVCLALLLLGLVMIYSASIALSESPKFKGIKPTATYFLMRQALFIVIGLVAGSVVFRVPLEKWQRWSPYLFIGTIVLLIMVLIPGIGHGVNGAKRWISLYAMNLQPSEVMKLMVVLYAADYTVRKQAWMHELRKGFLPMAAVVVLVGALLQLEPDLGAFMVIAAVAFGILFLGGINVRIFAGLSVAMVFGFVMMVLLIPYRRQRFFAYLDPFEEDNAAGKAYQLTHSLIAFGRGEWLGVGLGGSVEKLHYLPEAHTDFLLAVIGEELGLVGVAIVVALFFWLVQRSFEIGRQAIALERTYAGLVAKGVGIWIGTQAFINMGVNLGLLPTKGLTLPLMSYGGSGILVNCLAFALVLRVDYENRILMRGGRV